MSFFDFFKSNNKKEETEKNNNQSNSYYAGQIADELNKNLKNGTDITLKDMDLFRWKGEKVAKVGYEQAKGNLFEYIEQAKFERNNANAGYQNFDKSPVTDIPASKGGYGGHTAPDDFRAVQNGKVVFRGQAKVNNNPNNTANNFLNPKYRGMQRITTSDTVEDVKNALAEKLQKGEINRQQYDEVMRNIRKGLTDDRTGISSGGTTTAELEQFRDKNGKIDTDAVIRYSRKFELKQVATEAVGAAQAGATAGAIMSGVINGVQNCFEVYKDRKSLEQALKDTGLAVGKGAVRGGVTGGLSAGLRYVGAKGIIPVLADSTVATAVAAGVVDCGASILAYAQGEISGEQLVESVKTTAVQTTAAWYFTTAIKTITGATSGVFLPMAVYSVTSYMIMSTKAIIDQAMLNAAEYRRVAALYNEETKILQIYRNRLNTEMQKYRDEQKLLMDGFLNDFDRYAFSNFNYSAAIVSAMRFADAMQIEIQHRDYNDFKTSLNNHDRFILK